MKGLPLLESDLLYLPPDLTPGALVRSAPARHTAPPRLPEAGEQYRFHFDMTKCIGCKCCVVACNEQNGNPAAINWRRVGEIEGGHYPHTQRHYLSMGCNHCVEPSCLNGCPVEAYTKNFVTGVVEHSADTCIGCQYCTWNCSYGVPQYNPARGVVGKCDLCHNRLSDGMAPACVQACPEGAIAVEIVNIAEWRADYLAADAPGLPSADDSISTTRITLPADLAPDTGRVDTQQIRPEHPHLPLVFMLVLTQLALGAFAVLWLLDWTGHAARLWISALASLALAGVSLGVSTLHLGRPVYAWRAMR
ncbi:MAG: dimethyl sulfoxide reductase anchor subunit, partial [Acidobacteriota bacterium]|nr:dimethyl sulfoxide reductase anchor subunit [Acidobacteriota bacterium]